MILAIELFFGEVVGVSNNEDLRLIDSNYWRQLCFAFLGA